MRGKDSKGQWRTPFSPLAYEGPGSVNGWGDITEGFTVQYHWSVPQDVHGLIGLMGKKRFKQRLDSLFQHDLPDDIPGAHDIQGRIGAYWHGNEPCHHIAYLYNYIGEGWQCQRWVRTVVDRFYGNQPGSLCGNDDCGQMSAWYIFGKQIRVKTRNWSTKALYVNKVYLNGAPYTKSYLTWDDLKEGADILFVMSSKPNKNWATRTADIAP